MRTIADLEIVVGAERALSLKQLEKDLRAIIKALPADATKITFTSNLSAIRKEAEEIAKIIRSVGGIINPSGTGTGGTGGSSSKGGAGYSAQMKAAIASETASWANYGREASQFAAERYRETWADIERGYSEHNDIMKAEAEKEAENNERAFQRWINSEEKAEQAANNDAWKNILANRAAATKAENDYQQGLIKTQQAELQRDNLLGKITGTLQKYNGAQNSSNEIVRGAYENIASLQHKVEALDREYGGNKGSKEYTQKLGLLNKELQNQEQLLKSNGAAAQTFGAKFSAAFKSTLTYFSTYRVIMAAFRAIRQMIQASIELDSTFAQLQVVTKESDATMAHYADTVADAAKRIGASITDLTSSTTVFARLGYSLEEAEQLAEYTTKLQNVANIGVEDAQNAITAIVKAYSSEVDIDNIESVMDKLVEVGKIYCPAA